MRPVCLTAALLLTLYAATACAAPRPAVARIVVQESGATAFGSGSLIDKRDGHAVVITNWHVVKDAAGKIEVQFPDGFRSEARAIKLDEDWDLAALVIWSPPAEPVRISATAPRPGDPLTICGYGQGEYREATGRCTEFYAPEVGLPHELVELSVEARQGDSGGPILNDRGELAGVLFGAANGTTLGSFSPRVETFLASVLPGGQRGDPRGGQQGGGSLGPPTAIPATPAMIAHAPPRNPQSTKLNQPTLEHSRTDGGWQTLTAPQELATEVASNDGGPLNNSAAASNVDTSPMVTTPKDSMPWPERPVANNVFAGAGGDRGTGGFEEWTPATPQATAVAAIPAAASNDAAAPETIIDTVRNVLAVIGVTFLFLHLVRMVS